MIKCAREGKILKTILFYLARTLPAQRKVVGINHKINPPSFSPSRFSSSE
jgi:hypothetical protein